MTNTIPGETPRSFVPEWASRWAVPEFSGNGVRRFERKHLKPYFYQKDAPRKTADFFGRLQMNNLLQFCLSLEEGVNLIAREVVPIWFPEGQLCLWRSVAVDSEGNMFMPWIQNIAGQAPVIRWWWLEYNLYSSHQTFLVKRCRCCVVPAV